jgi:hypothetical protein
LLRFSLQQVVVAAALVAACGGDTVSDPAGPGTPRASLALTFTNLTPPASGQYEAWLTGADGRPVSLGRFTDGTSGVRADISGATDGARIDVTWEAANDADGVPSAQRLLTGRLAKGRATLDVADAVTLNELPMRASPGQFTMFSPSDNGFRGYPSHEESGIWLFNMAPNQTEQRDMWVRLTPLREGWVYEGWMVRDIDTPSATWLSYGKFRPDNTGAVNQRDDTGWGPFSGHPDFLKGEEEFPGDDWISNDLGLPLPNGLSLPLNLRERNPSGTLRWTHVITVEPASDKGEPYTTERPFILRPYQDSFGDGAPGVARAITRRDERIPRGTAVRTP